MCFRRVKNACRLGLGIGFCDWKGEGALLLSPPTERLPRVTPTWASQRCKRESSGAHEEMVVVRVSAVVKARGLRSARHTAKTNPQHSCLKKTIWFALSCNAIKRACKKSGLGQKKHDGEKQFLFIQHTVVFRMSVLMVSMDQYVFSCFRYVYADTRLSTCMSPSSRTTP